MRGEGIGFINCFLKDVSFNVAKMRLFYLGMWRRVEIVTQRRVHDLFDMGPSPSIFRSVRF
jgi:hypothetical protein